MLYAVLLIIALDPRTALAGPKAWHLAVSAMALTNASEQGGSGPAGTTLLTHSDLLYSWGSFGFGGFFQYDRQGSSETDATGGPKLELSPGIFYFEAGYGVILQRSFTDRSIAKQSGSAWVFGAGVRVPLSSSTTGGGAFLQFSYKYRIQTIKKQDETVLDDPITQKDGYPVFGLGVRF